MKKQKNAVYDLNGKYIMFFLLLLAILANLKSIFLDCDIDTEYAVAMSYRMLQGDGMLQQMWEPHQTSAFLCTLLMKPFVAVTGSTTGIVLYLHTMGVLIHGAIVWIFYSFMRKRVDLTTARLMSIFFLAVRPKDIVLPEFSNMQIWFSVLLFLCILYYLEHQTRKLWLMISSVFLCLEAISYPSCVLVLLSVLSVLWIYSHNRLKDILLFSGACLLQGCVYVGYFVVKLGDAGALLETIQHIISGDASHQSGGSGLGFFFWENLLVSVVWLAGSFAVAFLINKLWGRKRDEIAQEQHRGRLFILAGCVGLAGLVIRVVVMPGRMAHVSLYLLLIILALFTAKHCESGEGRMVYVGMSISAASFAATLLLSNLDISSTLMYLVLAVMVSFIPLKPYRQQTALIFKKTVHYDVMILFCLLCLFQRGVTVKTLGGFSDPLKIGGIVKSGPELGILADYMGANIRNTTMAEWDQFVHEGDNVLIVEKEGTSTIGYLYGKTGISAPSTICTPTNDETLLEYWAQYPDKIPDVIAVQCWYGELAVDGDSWIMQWIETEFHAGAKEDGTFFRFYRRNPY